jgi:hypothetical protein
MTLIASDTAVASEQLLARLPPGSPTAAENRSFLPLASGLNLSWLFRELRVLLNRYLHTIFHKAR